MAILADLGTLTDDEKIQWKPNVGWDEYLAGVASYYSCYVGAAQIWSLRYVIATEKIEAYKQGEFKQSINDNAQGLKTKIETQMTTATDNERIEFLGIVAALLSTS